MITRILATGLIASSPPGIAHAQSHYAQSASGDPLLIMVGLALTIAVVAGVFSALDGDGKKPCTCKECRPDLYPETIEQLALRAAYERGMAEVAKSKQAREMEEAHLAEQRAFFKKNGLTK